jgi:protein ImuA
MSTANNDIITRLKLDILPLEGLRGIRSQEVLDMGLGGLNESFPLGHFPMGAMHEFISQGAESSSAAAGFISGLAGFLMKKGGAAVWIGSSRTIFPPALKMFGIDPSRIVFIDLKKEKDVLWAMEESLKCSGLSAVIGEIPEFTFTTSRRFQLVVEQSRVTGFILRSNPRSLFPNACVSRWQISSLPSFSDDGLPGLGHPRWKVELLKIRNGKPGSWELEWNNQRFHQMGESVPSIILHPKRKTG